MLELNIKLPEWVVALNKNISDELSNTKVVKFNTHRNRKALIDKINKILNDTLAENVPSMKVGRQEPTITKIHDNPERGVTVMTTGESQKGDSFLEQRLNEKKAPVRIK
jgi:hypothetical protein